jgi:hypothetical protein
MNFTMGVAQLASTKKSLEVQQLELEIENLSK